MTRCVTRDLCGAHRAPGPASIRTRRSAERQRLWSSDVAHGSLDIPVRDISQQIAVAAFCRSPVERPLVFARERGWKNLKLYAAVGDDFARDHRGLAPDESEWPALDAWVMPAKLVCASAA